MSKYEYIRLILDFVDMGRLSRFGDEGLRVVAVVPRLDSNGDTDRTFWALLERTK